MADLRKLKDDAADAVAKGKYRKGAELYVELARIETDDPMWPHRAGEAWKRAGARAEAIAQLGLAAEGYAKNGFLLKAISVAKMILELDPGHGETQSMLVGLYAKRDGATHPGRRVPLASSPRAFFSATHIPPSLPPEPMPAVPPSLPLMPVVTAHVPRSVTAAPPPPAAAYRPVTGIPSAPARPITLPLPLPPPPPPGRLPMLTPPPLPRAVAPAITIELDLDGAVDGSSDGSPRGSPDGSPSASADLKDSISDFHVDVTAPALPKLAEPMLGIDIDESEDFNTGADPIPLPPLRLPVASPPRRTPKAPAERPLTIDDLEPGLLAEANQLFEAERIPTIDRLPLNRVIPGARLTGDFAIPAFDIPLDEESAPGPGQGDATAPSFPAIPLFSSLDAVRLRHVIERSRIVNRVPGQAIVRQGERGDSLYVVVRGEVAVTLDGIPTPVSMLGEGAFFGELALLSDQKRFATVTAVTDVELLEIGRDLVWELIEDAPEVLQILLRFFRDRLIDRLITTSQLFSPFSGGESRQLAKRFHFLEIKLGTSLLTEGQRSEGLFVILCGHCNVVSLEAGPLAVIGPGDVCGEMSLLTREPCIATVTARTRVWALGLPRASFQELILTHPQILIYINDLMEARRAMIERRIHLI